MKPALDAPDDLDAALALRWAGCLAIVMGLHAGAVWFMLHRAPPMVLEPPAPEAVMLDLAPPEPAPEPTSQPTPEPQPATPPIQQPEPLPAPPTTPPAEPPAVQPPEPEPEPVPAPTVAVPLSPVLPPTPLIPEPAAVLPEPPKPPPPRPVAKPRPPAPRPVVRPPSTQPLQERAVPTDAAPALIRPAPAAPAPGPVAVPVTASNAVPDWRGALLGKLQRAKRYPDRARMRGEQGVAYATFTMDRQGHVLSASLVRSSGSSTLDEEAVELIRRAEPLPPLPPEMPGGTITLTVPINFSLR